MFRELAVFIVVTVQSCTVTFSKATAQRRAGSATPRFLLRHKRPTILKPEDIL